MIEKIPFGSTGHLSSRTLFGAAALGAMRQERADRVLELVAERGINHIDTAASYGESELRLGPWMERARDQFFLASKTGERTYQGALESIQRSLERLRTDRLDLIQLHNLVNEDGWQTAMSSGGALEAAIEARDQGLVRFIGVTGHGTRVADMHLRSLEHFSFDSVLLPYNFTMMQNPDYATSFERLVGVCRQRGIAIQTIKSIARRRWLDDDSAPRFSWYEPLKDSQSIRRAVHWVLHRSDFFLNTSSDANLLTMTLDAAAEVTESLEPPSEEQMATLVAQNEMKPLFIRGFSDNV